MTTTVTRRQATITRVLERAAAREAEHAQAVKLADRAEAKATRLAAKAKGAADTAKEAAKDARWLTRRAEAAGVVLLAEEAAKANRLVARLAVKATRAKDAAKEARAEARRLRTAARRAERAAAHAAFKAATVLATTVERITQQVAELDLAPAEPATEQAPAPVMTDAELEEVAERFQANDAQAKELAKLADADKALLRRVLGAGQRGRVTGHYSNTGTHLDTQAVAVHYAARGLVPPRKTKRPAYKLTVSPAADTEAA
ncbi:hypothetical protein [Streptomyces triticirhizae]|uniref:TolA protein n=1 Tax=Streptomyces triticirhizae TaxID=2483353 RepID=A0A3M2M3R8_9ACTN|nr:hypothetical protein [Streptomyces triticirhizae]RMI44424.1 hypothetical protein EBN88_05335 [Streptomyces triticirhizae]